MKRKPDQGASASGDLDALLGAIVEGRSKFALQHLKSLPGLALCSLSRGASRKSNRPYFFQRIRHYVYEGDTALHVAAAAHDDAVVRALIAAGADAGARNRRGAQPLHYVVDGSPDTASWSPAAQRRIIKRLVSAGADPDAHDKSGVGPLHRAVRNRASAAVQALLQGGVNPRAATLRGSTPLLLAQRSSGASGSGSPRAKAEQALILKMLKDVL
jgi:ankyrin repeat protein